MPETQVIFFSERDGRVPLLDWMDTLQAKAQDKCFIKIERLKELGYDLRRPEADYLRDGIYELRISFRRIPHRILYFFNEGRAVLVDRLIKESKVPPNQIDETIRRKSLFKANPQMHTYEEG